MAEVLCEIALRWLALGITDGKSKLVLVPSGNKPLSEPIVTQIYIAIQRHYATVS